MQVRVAQGVALFSYTARRGAVRIGGCCGASAQRRAELLVGRDPRGEGSWGLRGLSQGALRPYAQYRRSSSGGCLSFLVAMLGIWGCCLSVFLPDLGLSRAALGISWHSLRPSWGHLEVFAGRLEIILEASWAVRV